MAQRIITFGQPYGLQIQIGCARSSSGRSAEEATKGKLLLWIGEDLIWGKSLAFRTNEPIEWSWVELLEFLSNAWPYLEFEFGYPFGLNPIGLHGFAAKPRSAGNRCLTSWSGRKKKNFLLTRKRTICHEVYTDFSCPLFGS